MAIITGSVTSGSFAQYYTFYIDYSVSQNVAGNYSVVTASTYMRKDKSTQTAYGNNKNASLSVAGTARATTFSYDFRSSSLKLVQSESFTVYHNADGTKSAYIGASANFGTSLLGAASAGATVTLPTIPRASSIGADAASTGANMTVRISAASAAFTHRVTIGFGSYATSRDFAAGVTSGTIAIPANWAAAIPAASSGVGTATLYTYSGGALIGTKAINVTIYAAASLLPTLSGLQASDVGEVPKDWGVFVRTKSKLQVQIQNPAGVQGSSITGYSISGGGFSGTGQTLTTGFLPQAGNLVFTGYVKDSRGRQSASRTLTVPVVEYSPPAITKKTAVRCNGQGVADAEGTYLQCQMDYTFASVNGKNAAAATVQYRRVGESSFINAGAILPGQTKIIGGGGIGNTASYEVVFAVEDGFTTTLGTVDIPTSTRLINVRAGGDGIAFGKFSERQGLESAWDIHTRGTLHAAQPIGIQSGGTGGATAVQALANLGIGVAERFTPTFYGATTRGSPTYNAREMQVVRLGKLVVAFFTVTITNKGGMAGQLCMTLPSVVSETFVRPDQPAIAFWGVKGTTALSTLYLSIRVTPGTNTATVLRGTQNVYNQTSIDALDTAIVENVSGLSGMFMYLEK